MKRFGKADIVRLLGLLNDELNADDVRGEVYLVGGAVMCLSFAARPSTRDLDAYFAPTSQVRKAAARVSTKAGVPEGWLNDGVKGYLSSKGEFNVYLDLSHLKVFVADAEYLLAMKCLAMRLGEDFHDLDDVRYLLRNLGIESYEQATKVIGKFYPLERFPQKTLYVLEELLSSR